MARRADIVITELSANTMFSAAPTNYVVQATNGALYVVYIDNLSDLNFKKSIDGGLTWSNPTTIHTGTVISCALWYDRWSNIAADRIHVAWTETVNHDTRYRTIDTASSDALSTETVIFAGTSATATGAMLTISRARGGNVYCRTTIDNGAEGGFFRLQNANVPNGAWDAARTINEALAGSDNGILVPGFAADNQDMMLMFWDNSANEVSRQIYDDSANSWAETSIATGMTKGIQSSAFPHFDAVVDLTNNRIVFAAWSGVDTANADLRCWTITESAITEVTNIVLNSGDDQGLVGIGIDTNTGYWYAVYGGKSDGSETFLTSINLYYKVSQNSGSTWGSETLLTTLPLNITWLIKVPRFTGSLIAVYQNNGTNEDGMRCSVDRTVPTARSLIGL